MGHCTQFEITYHLRLTIKVHALTDFMVVCADIGDSETIALMKELWKLYVDGSSNKNNLRAKIILITLAGYKFHLALRFRFEDLNNEVEYEALLTRLRMETELKANVIHYYSDSQLNFNQVLKEY